jgi:hypothetical protein
VTLQKRAAFVPQRSDIRQRLQSLRSQYDAALAAAVDFVLVGKLGTQLKALQQQSAQLPLSEEDYCTLPAQHADLVQQVMAACRELMKARDYAALGPLSTKLKELKALDLPVGNDNSQDPVLPDVGAGTVCSPMAVADAQGATEEEDDGALDPVLPAGLARLGAAVGICSHDGEGANSSAYDPVLPSDGDAIRKA